MTIRSMGRQAGLVTCASFFSAIAVSAPFIELPFDASYEIRFVQPSADSDRPIPGVPPPYGAMAFEKGNFDTLLLVGHAYSTDQGGSAAIYSIGLKRDADGHVIGFADNAKLQMLTPGAANSSSEAGGGLGYGPNGVLFYTSLSDSSLAMIESQDSQVSDWVDLSSLTPTPVMEAAPLTFVPRSFPGEGKLKVGAHNGHFYGLSLTSDGGGTYYVTGVSDIGKLAGSGTNASGDFNVPTGFGYVAAGNPLFAAPALLAAQCDFNTGDSKLYAYQINGKGDPDLGTARAVVNKLCAAGAVIDPQTGDMLFTSYYGYPALTVLRGFTVAPPTVAFAAAKPSIDESEGKAAIIVKRLGSTVAAATVSYSSAEGSAKAGINYTDVSGILTWAAGESGDKSFDVPIKNDGVYTDKLTVRLKLRGAKGAALGGPADATLGISNTNPPPTVSLVSVDRRLVEANDETALSVNLDTVSGLPVTVPFRLTGTMTFRQDYGLDLDENGPVQSITIPAGSINGSLPIYLGDDSLPEDEETLTATMEAPVNAVSGAVTANTITIVDNDTPSP